MIFDDRDDAGRKLAAALENLRGEDVVVLGLPRGGVPVAAHVAAALDVPLDVIVVCKLGVPAQPELAFGAVGEGGVRVLNEEIIRLTGLTHRSMEPVQRQVLSEVSARAQRFRGSRAPEQLTGRTAIVVDDGVATGASARAACQVARAHGAARVVMAAPVGAADAISDLADVADEVICLVSPQSFAAVGQYYRDFTQVAESEVLRLLDASSDSHHRLG